MRFGKLGAGYGRLGAQQKPPTSSASNVILLADGSSKVLQTDGSSHITKAQ